MYKVIKKFHDLQDATKTKNGMIYHEYNVGDKFPRNGHDVSEERLKELAGTGNKQGAPLIELVEEESVPKEATKKPAAGKTADKKARAKASVK